MRFLRLITLLSICHWNFAAGARPPNIVLFFSDDAGYADFGFQGSREFKTPNLDQLAKRGAVFVNAYSSSAVCSPSRAGLLTGKHPARLGMEFNIGTGPGRVPQLERGLPEIESTLGNYLQQIGFVTGFVGKWHLGRGSQFHPLNRGFDSFFGIIDGHSRYRQGEAKRVYANYEPVDPAALPYITDAFGDAAVQFVEDHFDQPFYLQISFTAPHPPLQALDSDLALFTGVWKHEKRARNAAMIYRMDVNIGRVMRKVEELGLTSNTLFIFANDNGGDPGDNGASNAPLKGAKGTLLEGGIRTPFLVSWKGHIQAGNRIEDLISTLDIVPTVFDVTGRKDTSAELDGISLLPALKNDRSRLRRDRIFWRTNWSAAVRKGEFKLIRTPFNQLLLFDLLNDPGESTNLVTQRPQLVNQLVSELADWESGLQEPLWEMNPGWKKRVNRRYYP